MTEPNQVYRCNVCGNIVQVLHTGSGELVCCGKPMECLKENTVDASVEKHVPIIEKTEKGIKAKVGSVPHPMEKEHYIEWIEVIVENRVSRKFLKPGDLPEARFEIIGEVRAYCNLHGLWKSI